jgi:hypothetical protein
MAFDFLDLKAQYAGIRDEVMAAVTRVMDSQYFILGPEVKLLEEELAAKLGDPQRNLLPPLLASAKSVRLPGIERGRFPHRGRSEQGSAVVAGLS